jgi:Domain of unknown function (DUF4388)
MSDDVARQAATAATIPLRIPTNGSQLVSPETNVDRKMKAETTKSVIVNDISGVSLQSLLHVIENDTATCTVSVKNDKKQRSGTLFFREGKLIDAECSNNLGLDAAYKLCPYKAASFSIGPPTERPVRIDLPLSHILLHATVLTDEKQQLSKEAPNNTIPLQHLIDFLNTTKGIHRYLLLSRQGKIVFQSKQKPQPKKMPTSKEDPTTKHHTALITRHAISLFNRSANDDCSPVSHSEILDDGKAVLAVFYQDMALALLLEHHDYTESITTFLHRQNVA